jgi:hypothetical protein
LDAQGYTQVVKKIDWTDYMDWIGVGVDWCLVKPIALIFGRRQHCSFCGKKIPFLCEDNMGVANCKRCNITQWRNQIIWVDSAKYSVVSLAGAPGSFSVHHKTQVPSLARLTRDNVSAIVKAPFNDRDALIEKFILLQ